MRIRDAVTPQGQLLAIIPMEPVLDSTVTLEVRRQLQQIMDFGYHNLVLDMSQVNSFDSAGIGVLVSTLKRCRMAKGNLALCHVPEMVQLALEIASIEQILPIFKTEAEAIANFPQ